MLYGARRVLDVIETALLADFESHSLRHIIETKQVKSSSGINTVLYYGSIIVSEHFPGQSTSMALIANVTIGTVNFLLTIVAMVFLDRWGRRAILMIASGGMGLALALLVIGLNVRGVSPY